MTTPTLETLMQQCRTLTNEKRYKEALAVAQQMLQLDAENLAVHKLLALLYGLNNQHRQAHGHYMLLVQFDPSYTLEHCMLVAQGYAEKGEYKAAGLLCMAAFHRLQDRKLAMFGAECFDQAGEKELATNMRKA